MKKGFIAGLLTIFLMAPTSLWAMTVGYDIGPYSMPGYSASWLHSATSHQTSSDLDLDNDGSNDSLYMSGSTKIALTGMLWGDWDGTVLSNITGMLNDNAVTGGSLGGDYYTAGMDPLWYLDVAGAGTFYFEQLNSMINQITADYLLLWGQNTAAYLGSDCVDCDERRWGMDLYGEAKALPEPGTFLLMVLGLLSLPLLSRRRELLAARNR